MGLIGQSESRPIWATHKPNLIYLKISLLKVLLKLKTLLNISTIQQAVWSSTKEHESETQPIADTIKLKLNESEKFANINTKSNTN